MDNHWALRDFASRLMANICHNFNSSTNHIQTRYVLSYSRDCLRISFHLSFPPRVTRMFSDAMRNEKSPLVSYYGAIAGLQELGPEVVKVFIVPYIQSIGAS